MRPTSSMLSSIDPEDKTCEARFTTGSLSITTRITNDQFFNIARLLEHAHEAGRRDGLRELGLEIERVVERYSQ